MSDTSSISRQGFQQPVAQTFQPGRNVEQRAEREAVRQSDPQAAKGDAGAANSQGAQAKSSNFQTLPEGGKIEHDPSAQRGSIVNIEV